MSYKNYLLSDLPLFNLLPLIIMIELPDYHLFIVLNKCCICCLEKQFFNYSPSWIYDLYIIFCILISNRTANHNIKEEVYLSII